ncbi:two-component response regulator [uncultured Eubacterium sp.]|uniref:LytTR family DNA-binding domain-containing protein n=1 Tax=Emergencia sp. TaxID=1926557 RepID=UPI0008220E03|nr:two-component response regulator [uncultured Eubacterium sp.]
MKISVREVDSHEEEEIIIKCHEMNDDILELVRRLKMNQNQLTAYVDDRVYRIPFGDVFYFETVDSKAFLYCEDRVYETKLKLYEFEDLTRAGKFFRASKSTIINTTKISHVKPSMSGRFEVYLKNGECVLVSRQYVPELKRQIGL